MSIGAYDRSGQEQGTYDKNTRGLALYDGSFTGELFEYNNTRIGVVEYGGRLKLDSREINASSSGSGFGDAVAGIGVMALLVSVIFGPRTAGGALVGAMLNRDYSKIIKQIVICSGILFLFWLPFKFSPDPDSAKP